jgi:hypothetical protein
MGGVCNRGLGWSGLGEVGGGRRTPERPVICVPDTLAFPARAARFLIAASQKLAFGSDSLLCGGSGLLLQRKPRYRPGLRSQASPAGFRLSWRICCGLYVVRAAVRGIGKPAFGLDSLLCGGSRHLLRRKPRYRPGSQTTGLSGWFPALHFIYTQRRSTSSSSDRGSRP